MSIKKAYYYVDVKEIIKKQLKKLDKVIQKRILKKFVKLESNPIPRDKRHILDFNNSKVLCEFSIDKYRIYYIVYQNKIVIDMIEYLGKIEVDSVKLNHKSGNKNYPNQQKFIKWLKKVFRK